jgi:hypothetical protein
MRLMASAIWRCGFAALIPHAFNIADRHCSKSYEKQASARSQLTLFTDLHGAFPAPAPLPGRFEFLPMKQRNRAAAVRKAQRAFRLP